MAGYRRDGQVRPDKHGHVPGVVGFVALQPGSIVGIGDQIPQARLQIRNRAVVDVVFELPAQGPAGTGWRQPDVACIERVVRRELDVVVEASALPLPRSPSCP